MRTFRTGYGLARDVVIVVNPRVHAGLPDLICRTQPTCLFKSGELVGAERPVAVVVARDVPNRIVESRHNALPDVHPAGSETSLRASTWPASLRDGAQHPCQLPPQALFSQGY